MARSLADCIRGGLGDSIAKGIRKSGTTISGVTGDTGYDMVGRLAANLPKGLTDKMRNFRSALKNKLGTTEEIYYTNLLSNPTTIERNGIGNIVEMAFQTAERSVRGGLSADPGQVASQFAQFGEGLRIAKEQALKAWASGVPAFLAEENRFAAEGGMSGIKGVFKTFPRLMAATDDFFTSLAFHMDVQDQIYRKAAGAAKGNKAAMKKAVIQLQNNVPDDIAAEGIKVARRAVFRDLTEGAFHKGVTEFFSAGNQIPVVGKFLLPFVKTPINLAKRGIEYTPLNAIYGVGQLIGSGNTKGQLNVIRGSMGTLMMAGMANSAFNGTITGDGSHMTDGERNAKMKAGWQPNSIKVGDRYISYRNLGPLTTLLTIGGQVGERAKDTGEFNAEVFFGEKANILADTLKGVMDSTFLPQVAELLTSLAHPEQYGGTALGKGIDSVVRTLRAQVLPTAVPSLVRAVDPTIRDRSTMEDLGKFPVQAALTSKGRPKLGLFGEEIKRTGLMSDNFADIFINPLRATQIANDPLVLEIAGFQDAGLEEAGFMPPNITDRSLGFKEDTLSEDEKFIGSKGKGFLQRMMMERVMSSGSYATMDPQVRLRVMRKSFDRASRIANQRIRNLKRNGTPITFRDIVKGFV